MRKIEYKTISSNNLKQFDAAVNAALAEGWEVSTVLNTCEVSGVNKRQVVQYSIGCIKVTDPAEA